MTCIRPGECAVCQESIRGPFGSAQARIKKGGVWWTELNAHALCQLRTLRANRQWNNYWRKNGFSSSYAFPHRAVTVTSAVRGAHGVEAREASFRLLAPPLGFFFVVRSFRMTGCFLLLAGCFVFMGTLCFLVLWL